MIGLGYTVDGDLFGISQRIKALDPDYFVFYSYKNKRYEVHCKGQKGSTLAVVLPYPCLDERSFLHVAETRRENKEKLLREIENANKAAEKEAVSHAVKQAEKAVESVFKGEEI